MIEQTVQQLRAHAAELSDRLQSEREEIDQRADRTRSARPISTLSSAMRSSGSKSNDKNSTPAPAISKRKKPHSSSASPRSKPAHRS